MYGNRHTFPSPTATPIIVITAPNRDPKVSRVIARAFYAFVKIMRMEEPPPAT